MRVLKLYWKWDDIYCDVELFEREESWFKAFKAAVIWEMCRIFSPYNKEVDIVAIKSKIKQMDMSEDHEINIEDDYCIRYDSVNYNFYYTNYNEDRECNIELINLSPND